VRIDIDELAGMDKDALVETLLAADTSGHRSRR